MTKNSNLVEVKYFKEGGKYAMTETVDMSSIYDRTDPRIAIRELLEEKGLLHPHLYKVIMEPHTPWGVPELLPAETDAETRVLALQKSNREISEHNTKLSKMLREHGIPASPF